MLLSTLSTPRTSSPEWVDAINRNGWTSSIGIAGRHHPVRPHTRSALVAHRLAPRRLLARRVHQLLQELWLRIQVSRKCSRRVRPGRGYRCLCIPVIGTTVPLNLPVREVAVQWQRVRMRSTLLCHFSSDTIPISAPCLLIPKKRTTGRATSCRQFYA